MRDAAPPPLLLAIESGPPRAHVGPLVPGECRIGRAPENEIQLVDIAVSRQHARLAVIDGRWCLRDLGSTQGTILNAARLVPEQDVPLVDWVASVAAGERPEPVFCEGCED